ncbi:unnamed protein product [Prorocentrum cordatum]|uniref:Uncharacterized protein n=1 Tax=Prorocentrum cordatum TaxID=2364126 RepID=A0ABN9Q2Y7_9DINO|nr:unnamed protein product [Polarella glacialis]
MVADGPDEELQALLSARRQRVDEQGEEYSSGAGGEQRGADAKWSELDPAQFTPKSAYHRAHEALSAISEAAGAGEASGASGAGTPQAKAEAEAEAEAVAAASPRPALSPRPTPRRTPRQRPSQRRAAGAEGPPEPSPRRPPLQSPRDVAPMSARLARSGFDVTPLCSPRLDDQASPVGRHLQSPLDDQAAPVPPASAASSAGPSGSAVEARGAANFYAVFDAGEPDGAGKATPASPSVSVGHADAALPADVMELDMTLPIKLSELDMTLPIKAWTDGAGEGPALDAAPLAEVRRSQAAPAAARSDGDAAVWRAVVKGRLPKVQELAARGQLTSGRMQDHNGHSVFWNAVAFQQPEVALWLLRRFPPGPEPGVDLAEEHARRGDTLLHLCLYLTEFRGPAAEVFSAIFASPEVRRERANEGGQTFLHVAAARLNFWVLRLVLSRAPELVGLFCARDKHGLSPTDALMRRVGEVSGAVPDRPSVRALGPEAGAAQRGGRADALKSAPEHVGALEPERLNSLRRTWTLCAGPSDASEPEDLDALRRRPGRVAIAAADVVVVAAAAAEVDVTTSPGLAADVTNALAEQQLHN